MTPGDMVEVLGLPPRVPWTMRLGIRQLKVDGRWVDVKPVWRPAVYAGWDGDSHVFRWTDNLHFQEVPQRLLGTLVRNPANGVGSQKQYVRDWGELC